MNLVPGTVFKIYRNYWKRSVYIIVLSDHMYFDDRLEYYNGKEWTEFFRNHRRDITIL
jgi:hypothetical protein